MAAEKLTDEQLFLNVQDLYDQAESEATQAHNRARWMASSLGRVAGVLYSLQPEIKQATRETDDTTGDEPYVIEIQPDLDLETSARALAIAAKGTNRPVLANIARAAIAGPIAFTPDMTQDEAVAMVVYGVRKMTEADIEEITPPSFFEVLDERELNIIELTSRGFKAKELAPIIGFSLSYTQNLRNAIIHKVFARNMPEVIRLACEEGVFKERIPSRLDTRTMNFSATDLETFDLLSQGYTAESLAKELNASTSAIKARRGRIVNALGVNTVEHAIRLAWQDNLIPFTENA